MSKLDAIGSRATATSQPFFSPTVSSWGPRESMLGHGVCSRVDPHSPWGQGVVPLVLQSTWQGPFHITNWTFQPIQKRQLASQQPHHLFTCARIDTASAAMLWRSVAMTVEQGTVPKKTVPPCRGPKSPVTFAQPRLDGKLLLFL